MFVFHLTEKENSEVLVSDATVQKSQQTGVKAVQKNLSGSKAKSWVKSNPKSEAGSKQSPGRLKKEISQRNTYTYAEEPITRDANWNIYNGNPGFYITSGDGVNFGTVTTLSDSAFLKAQHTVAVPKETKPYGNVGKDLIVPNQDWMLAIILILWILFASVRVGFLKYLGQLFTGLVKFSAATRLYEQRGYSIKYGALRLNLIFLLTLPLSVFQIARFFGINLPGFPDILFYFALILIINGFLFARILLNQLIGSIVMLKEQTEESIFNTMLYYKALGLFLLPIVTIHAVIAETNFITIWVMAGVIAIMYIAALVRSIYTGNRKGISIFYLILYLCTLEILPLLLIFKLMSSK